MRLPKPRLHVAVTIDGLGTISIITHVLEPHALACCFVEEINLSGHYKGNEREIRKELIKKYPYLSVIERLSISYNTFTARLTDGGGFSWAHIAGTSLADLGVFQLFGP